MSVYLCVYPCVYIYSIYICVCIQSIFICVCRWVCIFPWLHASSHLQSLCPRACCVYVCIYTYMYIYICIHIYVFECAYSMCVSVLYLCMYVGECAHSPKFECRHFFNCCVLRPVVYTHVFIHSVYAHVCIHLCVSIDWCCFYYFVRNSLVALLEALYARYLCVDSIYIFMYVGGCVYSPEFMHHHFFDCCVRGLVVYTNGVYV